MALRSNSRLTSLPDTLNAHLFSSLRLSIFNTTKTLHSPPTPTDFAGQVCLSYTDNRRHLLSLELCEHEIGRCGPILLVIVSIRPSLSGQDPRSAALFINCGFALFCSPSRCRGNATKAYHSRRWLFWRRCRFRSYLSIDQPRRITMSETMSWSA